MHIHGWLTSTDADLRASQMENISSLATESESTCSSSSDSSHAGSFSTGWAASGTQGPLITFAPAGGPSQFIPIVQSQGALPLC